LVRGAYNVVRNEHYRVGARGSGLAVELDGDVIGSATVNRLSRFYGPGSSISGDFDEFLADLDGSSAQLAGDSGVIGVGHGARGVGDGLDDAGGALGVLALQGCRPDACSFVRPD